MNDTWIALTRYKLLEDRIRDLKRRAWMNLPPNQEIDLVLEEAQQELVQLKAWIEVNFPIHKLD